MTDEEVAHKGKAQRTGVPCERGHEIGIAGG